MFEHLEEHGGIRPRWGRNLIGRSLTFEERQEIMLWNAQHLSVREIGRRLGRSHSTISRELRRNVMPRNRYRAGLPPVWLTLDLWRFVSAGRMSPCPSPTRPSSAAMLSRSLASTKPR
nr:helix-turn-helix domain-containing protein [Glaciihabitans sp. INWT7]